MHNKDPNDKTEKAGDSKEHKKCSVDSLEESVDLEADDQEISSLQFTLNHSSLAEAIDHYYNEEAKKRANTLKRQMQREDMGSLKINLSGKGGFFVQDKHGQLKKKEEDDEYLKDRAKKRAMENDDRFPAQVFTLLKSKMRQITQKSESSTAINRRFTLGGSLQSSQKMHEE